MRVKSLNIRCQCLYLTFLAHEQKHFDSKQLTVSNKQMEVRLKQSAADSWLSYIWNPIKTLVFFCMSSYFWNIQTKYIDIARKLFLKKLYCGKNEIVFYDLNKKVHASYAPNVIYHWNINYEMNTFSNFYHLYRWINIDVFVNKDLRLKISWGNKQTKVKMHLHRTGTDRDRKSGITKPRHEFIKNLERPWIPWFVSNW